MLSGRLYAVLMVAAILLSAGSMQAQGNKPSEGRANRLLIRLAEIEIYPPYLTEYRQILQEEAAASVKVEPGVISIFPLYIKNDSTQIRIVEIYADSTAYRHHLTTPHFQKYKTTTQHMVKSLKLVDMEAIDPATMSTIFKKF